MLAAFCTGKGKIGRETEVPKAGGELRCSCGVRACGVCGTDLHSYNGAFPAMASASPGHEFCGEIAEAGEGVSGFAANGFHVVIEPIKSCRGALLPDGAVPDLPEAGAAGHVRARRAAEYVCVPSVHTVSPA